MVLVHWNQPTACALTIERFLRSSVPVTVAVVDNGSAPEQLAQLHDAVARINAEHAPGPVVKVLETGRNLGFGPGANVGLVDFLTGSRAPWVALAPHDAHPEADCLEEMLSAAADHPMAGLMCADVGDGMVPVIDPYFGGMVVAPPEEPAAGVHWENVDYPHGTLMMLSRACLREIGLFDERYFSYCEEAQLATRARAAGFEIGLVRGARVTNTHIGSGEAIVDYLQTRNTLLFVAEHSGPYHAFIRSCIAVLQLLGGLLASDSRPLIFHPRARLLGLRDFLFGRFGPPPAALSGRRRG